MSSTPPFASQSQPLLFDNATPDWNNSSQTHAAMAHIALVAPPLIRCQCGWSVFSSSLSHDDHCAFTNLSPHCIAMAASILAGSHKRKGAATSTQQSNPQRDFCSDFVAQHPHMTAADGSPLLTEHTPLVDVLRIACCGPSNFFGQHVTAPLDSRGRPRKKAGQIGCHLSAADSNKHSHAMRDAFALIAQWAKDQPDIKAMTDLFNLPAAAGESALGGLRLLCAAGFPSTLLQHVVRFTLQRLRSFTVEWCDGLVKQRRLGAIDEPTLCSYLADLINADADTLKLQPGELEQLAQALLRDGIFVFVQPHSSRDNDLRRFLIDTLNLNRIMDFQRNRNDFPQLFPSAPSTPTSPSIASMGSAPPSPSNSSVSSVATTHPPEMELHQSDDELGSDDDHGNDRKRQRVHGPSSLLPGHSLRLAQAPEQCKHDSVNPLPAAGANAASPSPSTPPSSASPADTTDFDWKSFLVKSLSSPEISPSTP